MPHTPGPWHVNGDYGNKDQHPNLTIESDFGQITKVLSENCDVDEQVIADAKLIAAAPELLAILEKVAYECEDTFFDVEDMAPEWVRIHAEIKAVLAKIK
jgi:hypothetical protein